MARYINEDEFIAWVKEHWCADCQNDNGLRCRACWIDDAIDIVEEAPAADVVPKSEVERLEQDVTRLVQEKYALIKNYAKCMKAYAEEIFAEIDELIFQHGRGDLSDKYFYLAVEELKEKYIGEQANGR